MNIRIEEIYSKKMFSGLIMGKPKDGMYEKSVKEIEKLLDNNLPIFNFSEVKWTQIKEHYDGKKLPYGTWGHITGVEIEIKKGSERYSFSVIFNICFETEKFEEKLNKIVSKVNYKKDSTKWDIGDL